MRGVSIEVAFNEEKSKGKKLLICFWDMQQRPSRNRIIQFIKRAEELKREGILVVAVHASKVNEDKLNEWIKESSIPFPVRMIQDDVEKTKFTWGVRARAWKSGKLEIKHKGERL